MTSRILPLILKRHRALHGVDTPRIPKDLPATYVTGLFTNELESFQSDVDELMTLILDQAAMETQFAYKAVYTSKFANGTTVDKRSFAYILDNPKRFPYFKAYATAISKVNDVVNSDLDGFVIYIDSVRASALQPHGAKDMLHAVNQKLMGPLDNYTKPVDSLLANATHVFTGSRGLRWRVALQSVKKLIASEESASAQVDTWLKLFSSFVSIEKALREADEIATLNENRAISFAFYDFLHTVELMKPAMREALFEANELKADREITLYKILATATDNELRPQLREKILPFI